MKRRALVLAAGFGTRLGLRPDLSKALIPIHGRPVIEWIIEALPRAAISTINVVTNRAHLPQFRQWHGDTNLPMDGPEGNIPIYLQCSGRRKPEERRGAMGDLSWWIERFRPKGLFVVCGDNFIVGDDPLGGLVGEECAITYRVSSDRGLGPLYLSADGSCVLGGAPKASPVECARFFGGIHLSEEGCALALRYASELQESDIRPDDLGDFVSWLSCETEVRAVELSDKTIAIDVGTQEGLRLARSM